MKTFKLIRREDLTGTSGTGHVASGRVMDSGRTIVSWVVDAKMADGSMRCIDSKTIFTKWEDAILLHGHSGRTALVWDETQEEVTDLDILKRKVA